MSQSCTFDLRDLLAQGVDPLETVVAQARSVAQGGRLTLVAPFDPVPLRKVLARLGYSSTAKTIEGGGAWRIDCERDGRGDVGGEAAADACKGPRDVGAPVRHESDGVHIDVRGLTPPLPMLAILRLCAGLDRDAQVVVHHDRDPLYLYPELAELGWTASALPAPEGEVRLRLTRADD